MKKNLNFDYFQDEFIQRELLTKKDLAEYVISVRGKHFRSEKFIKLIIKKNRCKEFVACIEKSPEHKHIFERIREFKKNETDVTPKGSTMNGIFLFFFL